MFSVGLHRAYVYLGQVHLFYVGCFMYLPVCQIGRCVRLLDFSSASGTEVFEEGGSGLLR